MWFRFARADSLNPAVFFIASSRITTESTLSTEGPCQGQGGVIVGPLASEVFPGIRSKENSGMRFSHGWLTSTTVPGTNCRRHLSRRRFWLLAFQLWRFHFVCHCSMCRWTSWLCLGGIHRYGIKTYTHTNFIIGARCAAVLWRTPASGQLGRHTAHTMCSV